MKISPATHLTETDQKAVITITPSLTEVSCIIIGIILFTACSIFIFIQGQYIIAFLYIVVSILYSFVLLSSKEMIFDFASGRFKVRRKFLNFYIEDILNAPMQKGILLFMELDDLGEGQNHILFCKTNEVKFKLFRISQELEITEMLLLLSSKYPI